MTEEEKKYQPQELMTLKEASKKTGRSTKYLRGLPSNVLHKIRLVPMGHIRYLRSEVEQITQKEKKSHGRE